MNWLIDQMQEANTQLGASIFNSAMLVFIIAQLVRMSGQLGALCRRVLVLEGRRNGKSRCKPTKTTKKKGQK